MLTEKTLIAVDYHRQYAENPTERIRGEYQELTTPPAGEPSQEIKQLVRMSLLDATPWKMVHLASPDFGNGPIHPLARWQVLFSSLNVGKDITNRTLLVIDKHLRDQVGAEFGNAEDEFAALQSLKKIEPLREITPYWERGFEYDRLVGQWNPVDTESRGAAALIAQGHKVVMLTGLWAEGEPGLTFRFKETGDWNHFSKSVPRTIPWAILRSSVPYEDNKTYPEGSIIRSNPSGKIMVYPSTLDFKYFGNHFLARIAACLGMNFIPVDDDPENVFMLRNAGFNVHTRTSEDEYVAHFVNSRGTKFNHLASQIIRYQGFVSGLGKLAGLEKPDHPHGGIYKQIF